MIKDQMGGLKVRPPIRLHPAPGGIPTYADSDSGISDTDVVASGSDAGDDSDNDRKEEDDPSESPEPMEEEEEAFEVELVGEAGDIPCGAGNSVPPDQECIQSCLGSPTTFQPILIS